MKAFALPEGPMPLRLAARLPWRAGLAYGVCWGVAVMALESMSFAAIRFGNADWLPFMSFLLTIWVTRGIALACGAQWLAMRASPALTWAGFLTLSLALSFTWDGLGVASRVSQAAFGIQMAERDLWLYNLWVLLAYGAPLFAFCSLAERERRTKALLARAEAARAEHATSVIAMRADATAQRIDLRLMLRTLDTARMVLGAQPPRAQQLLDDLVAFLRAAMPGLRSGRSTVVAELELVACHSQLLQTLDGGAPLCMVSIDPAAADLAFPPLLMLPLVEAAHAARTTGTPPAHLTLAVDGDCAMLRLQAELRPSWLPAALEHRMRYELDAQFGPRWRLDTRDAVPLEIALGFNAAEA